MTMYGLYVRDISTGDLLWFTVDKTLAPGRYLRGRHSATSPDVYLAESIPALILEVAPLIEEAEQRYVSSIWTTDLPPHAEKRRVNNMAEGLLQRLTETSSIWVENPDWVEVLRPFSR
ncbi:MAG: hypothetical protein PVG22_13880 [Chromatiales bacterium]|jgi:hypothetical protein